MPFIRRLGMLFALALVAATWSGSALAATAPSNTVPPTISGRVQQGETMSASTGTWTGDVPISFTYQWQRCDDVGASCVDLAGATSSSYTAVAGDKGHTLVVVVTATNGAGTGTGTSDPSAVVPTTSLSTTHFTVHYQTDSATTSAITQTVAGDIALRAERAYTAELADGYPAPANDDPRGGDSRIDIYIQDLSSTGALGLAVPDTGNPQTSGYIILDATTPDLAFDQHTIAHELFHQIQFGIWLPSTVADYWLLEGSAEWMGFRVDAYDDGNSGFVVGDWDMSLDCRDPQLGIQCDLNDYKAGGYSRWPFFEYLTERWGASFTKSIFDQGAAGAGSATTALANAIAAKGTTLADTFNDWTVSEMTSAFTVEGLQNMPPTPSVTIPAGTVGSLNTKTKKGSPLVTTGPIKTTVVGVNHLSVRYAALERGDPTTPDEPCYAATLSLSVALPSGVGAKPYFWWSQKNTDGTNKEAAQALSISGSTASITLPWDTCDWGTTVGYLSLPNPTTNMDGQDFKITGTITIDRSTLASAVDPPDPVTMRGPVVDTPDSAAAPLIEVFGPQLIHISASARALRMIVSSSGPGLLQASLGSRSLGSAKLRPGSNDVRFTLPASLFGSRGTAAAGGLLRLTPVSAAGIPGKAVVRRVRIDGGKVTSAKGKTSLGKTSKVKTVKLKRAQKSSKHS